MANNKGRRQRHAEIPPQLIIRGRALIRDAGNATAKWDLKQMMQARDNIDELCAEFYYSAEDLIDILEHC